MRIEGENSSLESLMVYLMDKGKITKIKDTSQNINIKFSNGFVFYFLLIVCILAAIGFFFLGKSILFDNSEYGGYDLGSTIIIIGGLCLFYIILVGVTIHEGKFVNFKVSYINDEQFKVNNKIYDIKNNDCMIDIIKKYQTNSNYSLDGTYRAPYREIIYLLRITSNNKKRNFQITPRAEQQLEDFIYNFDYEISDFKKEKMQLIKDMQDKFYKGM